MVVTTEVSQPVEITDDQLKKECWSWIIGFGGRFYTSWLQTATGLEASWLTDFLNQAFEAVLLGQHSQYWEVSQSSAYQSHLGTFKAQRRIQAYQRTLNFLMQLYQSRFFLSRTDTNEEFRLALDCLGRASINLGNLQVAIGSYQEALQSYRRYAHALKPYTAHSEIAFRYLGLITSAYWLAHRMEVPLEQGFPGEELSKLARESGHGWYEIVIEALHIYHFEFRDEYHAASEERLQRLLKQFEQLPVRSFERQLVSVFLIPLLSMRGDYAAVVEIYEKTLPPTDSIPSMMFPLLYVGIVAACQAMTGSPSVGMGVVSAVNRDSIQQGYGEVVRHCQAQMAYLFYVSRRFQEAEQYAERCLHARDSIQDQMTIALASAVLGIFRLRSGNPHQAEKLIAPLSYRTLQLVALCYSDLFFDLFQEAGRFRQRLHQRWDLERFFRLLSTHKSGSHSALTRLFDIVSECNRDNTFWPAQGDLEPLLKELEKRRLMLPLGNLCYWLAQRAEKLKRADDLRLLANRAQIALRGLDSSIFPESWHQWLNPLEKDNKLVSTILDISRTISSYRNLDDLYSGIVDLFGKITYSERRALYLMDENGVLRLKAARNFPDRLSVSVLKLVKQVARQGQGQVFKGEGDQVAWKLCVPLLLRDRLVGVIYEENHHTPLSFSEQYLEILTTFGMQLAVTIESVQAHARLQAVSQRWHKQNRYYREEQQREKTGSGILGNSVAISSVLEKIQQIAELDINVLVTGETGVGKELVAASIHYGSNRRNGPFVIANCAALSHNLIESELFGHEKGAFTGADQRKIGRFEMADEGTIFLDEIGELPMDLQSKLLRVLQHREFQRVGGSQTIRSDFRLVAATNRNLLEEVGQGRFRQDLYYRLNVFPIEVPPLRQRKEDIPLLAQHFLNEYASRFSRSPQPLSQSQLEDLMRYDWPGNVRELRHLLERAVILEKNGKVELEPLATPEPASQPPVIKAERGSELGTLDEAVRRHILLALHHSEGQIHGSGGAAELLDINPNTLRSKMKKLGIKTKKLVLSE